MLLAVDHFQERLQCSLGLLELVVLAAEKCGDHALADFYAARGEEHYAVKPVHQASCRAARGRIAARKNDRPAAVEHWQAAAETLLKAKLPLLVLRVAEDWAEIMADHDDGSEEPRQKVREACAVMGRPFEELTKEFQLARKGEAGGQPESAVL